MSLVAVLGALLSPIQEAEPVAMEEGGGAGGGGGGGGEGCGCGGGC